MKLAYLDASAVVKLFKPEFETVALESALRRRPTWISSELVGVEVRCTARRLGDPVVLERAEQAMRRIDLVPLTPAIRARAGEAFEPSLRALDAVHAATALALADELDAFFTYDADLRSAVIAEGLRVASPGAG